MTQRPHTDAERGARLDDWSALARDAMAHAEDPALEPTGQFGMRAEASALWAWPRAGLLRCKALSQTARLYAMASPAERAVLAPAMERLAASVKEAVEDARETGATAAGATSAQPRLPYRED